MKQLLTNSSLFLIFFYTSLSAQEINLNKQIHRQLECVKCPSFCDFSGQFPMPVNNCVDAIILTDICELNFTSCTIPTSMHDDTYQPSPLCSGIGSPENISWFAFYAEQELIEITITVLDCEGPDLGVQFGMYDGCACDGGQCVVGIAEKITESRTMTFPDAVVGNPYWIYVDGWAAAQCNYNLQVDFGSPNQGQIDIQSKANTICHNSIVTVSSVVSQADSIQWDCSGCDFVSGDANSFDPIEISWDKPGVYPISATIFNGACLTTDYDTIVVEAPIEQLNVICSPTENSLLLSWDSIPCVSTYQIFIDGLLVEMSYMQNEYLIENLDLDQDVNFSIFAESDCACPPSLTEGNCGTLTNISEMEKPLFNVYPNPFNSTLHIEISAQQELYYKLYDGKARIVQSDKMDNHQINVDDIPSGLYMILLESKDGKLIHMEKLLKL